VGSFLASVLWNGVAYTTVFVDAQHLTMTVGHADLNTATVPQEPPWGPISMEPSPSTNREDL
jgi:hypothetical protein